MNSKLITESDLLDIVFEKRNKAYGAYTLRKFYNYRLMKSIGIMMVAVIVFSAFTFLPATNNTGGFIVEEQVFGSIPPAAKLPEVKPVVLKQVKPTYLSVRKFLSNILIVNSKDSSDMLHDLKDVSIGDNTNIIPGNLTEALLVGYSTGFAGTEAPLKITEPIPGITQPIDNPEVMPEFPGGMAALRSFLERNLRNPGDLDEGELISVKVKFVVGYDGKLKSFELVQDGGSEFNNEVMRVLKKMPAWIPGKSRGQNVPVNYTIPVKFIPEG